MQNAYIVPGVLVCSDFRLHFFLQGVSIIGMVPQDAAQHMRLIRQKLVTFPGQIAGQHPVQKYCGKEQHPARRHGVEEG